MEIEKRKIGKKVDKNKELHFNNESSVNCVSVSKDVSGRIVVAFTYNSLLIGEVKKIPGYRWHPDKKSWSFPTSDVKEKVPKTE
jgi:hypothetical protein